jgi:lipoate---protein ligase
MQLRDISFPTPQENIVFDEILWRLAEKHEAGEFLRFWESDKIFIVLGRIGRAEIDVNAIHTQADNIPVLRRSSGGGTVLQGPGCLNYTLVLSKQTSPPQRDPALAGHPDLSDLHKSYEWIGAKVNEVMRQAGFETYFRPRSDLCTGPGEKKFSGNAQRRGKRYILHHGTILYNFDLSLISRYLNMPHDIPEYRKQRPHKDFVTNIPIDPRVFKEQLARCLRTRALQSPSAQELSFLKNSKISC